MTPNQSSMALNINRHKLKTIRDQAKPKVYDIEKDDRKVLHTARELSKFQPRSQSVCHK